MTRCGPFLVVWATSISAHHRWPFEGVSLRLFDLADSLWRIYWIDSTRVTDLKECFEGRQPRLGNQLVHVLSQAMNVTECLSRSIE